MRLNDNDVETSDAGGAQEGPADGGANLDAADRGADGGAATGGGKLREIFGTGSLTGGKVTGGTGGTGGLGTGAGDMSGSPFTGGDVMTGGDAGVDTTGAGPANKSDE